MSLVARGRGVRRLYVPPTPPFTDDFSGTFNSTTKWTTSYGGPTNVSGRLRLNCTSGFPSARTAANWDLRFYPYSVELVSPPAVGNGSTQTQMVATNMALPTDLGFRVQNKPFLLNMRGTGIGETMIPYDPVEHRWLRFRLLNQDVIWETAPDGATWTVRRTAAAPNWVLQGSYNVLLGSGHWGTETAPGYAEFDNFCLDPAAVIAGATSFSSAWKPANGNTLPVPAGEYTVYTVASVSDGTAQPGLWSQGPGASVNPDLVSRIIVGTTGPRLDRRRTSGGIGASSQLAMSFGSNQVTAAMVNTAGTSRIMLNGAGAVSIPSQPDFVPLNNGAPLTVGVRDNILFPEVTVKGIWVYAGAHSDALMTSLSNHYSQFL